MYLDPHYKALPFLSMDERSQVSKHVESLVMALAEAESVNKDPQSSEVMMETNHQQRSRRWHLDPF